METKHFGFVQFEFAGTLPVADGRYLAREAGEEGAQSVLVIETLPIFAGLSWLQRRWPRLSARANSICVRKTASRRALSHGF